MAQNISERDFKADKPKQKWTTDITQVSILQSENLSFTHIGHLQRRNNLLQHIKQSESADGDNYAK